MDKDNNRRTDGVRELTMTANDHGHISTKYNLNIKQVTIILYFFVSISMNTDDSWK